MVKRMLIDATHLEETRVVIASGTRLDEFDFESSTKKQLKGNIYLAKVTRVEPSLQAAFVDFGGNRHGFLPFSEIHPDYYQIPVADRMALLAEQQRMGGYGDADADFEPVGDVEEPSEQLGQTAAEPPAEAVEAATELAPQAPDEETADLADSAETGGEAAAPVVERADETSGEFDAAAGHIDRDGDTAAGESRPADLFGDVATDVAAESTVEPTRTMPLVNESADQDDVVSSVVVAGEAGETTENGEPGSQPEGEHVEVREAPQHLEVVGGADEVETEVESAAAERRRGRIGRHRYKIQEVIKRRQILLVQVVKEERGNKGAALTTYLSLAGRYCVLMPNTARGGGISRKISNPADRKRLKSHLDELEIPEGMAVILRTAAVERSKTELKRDYEYLLRQWDEVRELTLKSIAPALVYEEANLIKRSIRDHYTKDVDEVLVEGDEGYRTAKEFMRMLMPSHAKKVQQYRDPEIPLFHRYQIESQLDAMHNPVVTLKSGGYVVINPTEALVAIDVNSGRATRERNIEETAYKTNLEAADEIARQLRLRDLAGLIVIDFIDMEESRNQHNVEKRLKEAMRVDRARIQIGKISAFGLLELSRQRLRPSFLEASTERCPHCEGTGLVRSTESAALHVIRAVEEEGIRRRSSEIRLVVPTTVALYILNHKRTALVTLEGRYGFHIIIDTDDSLIPPNFRLERLKAQTAPPPLPAPAAAPVQAEEEPEVADEIAAEEEEAVEAQAAEGEAETREGEQSPGDGGERYDDRRRRSRRRRRRGGEERERGGERLDVVAAAAESGAPLDEAMGGETRHEPRAEARHEGRPDGGEGEAQRKRRRRGKRGGRRRRREGPDGPDSRTQEPGGQEFGGQEFGGQEFGGQEFGGQEFDETAEAAAAASRPEPSTEGAMPPGAPEYREIPRHPESREPAQGEPRGNGAVLSPQGAGVPQEQRSAEPEREAAAEPEKDRPKRKGWWQRLTQ